MSKFDKIIEETNEKLVKESKLSHDFGSFKPSTVKKSKKIRGIVEDALDDFWIAMAKKLPEVKSGDFSPEDTFMVSDTMTQAVLRWYDDNVED
jgi:hypothetical protein